MKECIYSPLKGKAIKIEDVEDVMFSEKMLGDGVAVYPEYSKGVFAKNSLIYAPCDGEIVMVFPEKHAIGIKTTNGNEVLIHMGIETVELNGAPFNIKCNVGDVVKRGDVLGDVNWKMIEKSGRDIIVPIICTNLKEAISIINDQGSVDITSALYSI